MLPLGQTMMMMTGAGLGSGRGRNWPNLNKLNLGSSSDMPPPPSLSSPPHPALLIPVEYAEYGVYSHIKPNALFIHSPLSLFSSPYFFLELQRRLRLQLRLHRIWRLPGDLFAWRLPWRSNGTTCTHRRACGVVPRLALAGRLKSSGSTGSGNPSSSVAGTPAGCGGYAAPLESALIFTLHVYQYSLSRKGGGKCPTHCCWYSLLYWVLWFEGKASHKAGNIVKKGINKIYILFIFFADRLNDFSACFCKINKVSVADIRVRYDYNTRKYW